MGKILARMTLLASVLFLAMPAFGATYFVAQTAGTVTCAGGSHTAITFTTLASTTLNPDDLVWLCGTITFSANSTAYTFAQSGTSGHPITMKWDTGANLNAPYFNFFGGIVINGNSNIVIDGGTNGIMQNTANGTGLANAAGSNPIYISGPSSNITVQNLTIANVCQHTSVTDTIGCQTGGNGDGGIRILSGATNVRVTNCTIHDTNTGIVYLGAAGDSSVRFDHNSISRTNWGLALATIGGTSLSFSVDNNDITCVVAAPCNWNDSSNNFHHNGMIIFPQGAGDIMQGGVIANNFIHDINTCTGGIFLDPASGDIPGVQIYNNVFFTTAGQVGPSDAWITVGIGSTGAISVNNTVIGPSAEGISGQLTPTTKNNIFSGAGSMIGYVLNSGYASVASDFNDWFNLTSGRAMAAGACCQATVADWVTLTGFDTHSITTDPLLTGSFLLGSSSPARNTGTNLTSLGIAGLLVGAPQTFGVGGSCGTGCLARPSTGPWDMGAYPFSASAGTTPTVPTSIQPTTLATGTVGVAYPAVAFTVTGGKAPYSFTISNAPPGVPLLQAGTPTTAGTYSPKVTAIDSLGHSVAQTYTITIAPAPVIVPPVVSPFPATYRCGETYLLTISATGVASVGAATFSCIKQ